MISNRLAEAMAKTHQELLSGTYYDIQRVCDACAHPEDYEWGDVPTEFAELIVRTISKIEPHKGYLENGRTVCNWWVTAVSNVPEEFRESSIGSLALPKGKSQWPESKQINP